MSSRPRFSARLAALCIGVSLAAASVATATPPDADTLGLDYIHRIVVGEPVCDTCTARVCPDRPVRVTVSGMMPAGCVSFRGLNVPKIAPFNFILADFVVDTCGRACPTLIEPFTATVELPVPPPLAYHTFTLITQVRSCPDTTVVASHKQHEIVYVVEPSCFEPPPLDSLLRSLVTFRVVPEPRCVNDSIAIRFMTNGCPPCVDLQSFVLDPITGLHGSFSWRPGCLELVCIPETLSVPLPRLAAGFYQFVATVDVHVLGTPVADSVVTFQEAVSFEISRTCDSTQVGCVLPILEHVSPVVVPGPLCAVEVPASGRGEFTLFTRTQVPLGGLQGRLECPDPFIVTKLAAPPGNPGIHVSWAREGNGARYVLFTTGGAPIPAGTSPVLAVTVICDSGATPGTRVVMTAPLEVASGPAGEAVPFCDISRLRLAFIFLCVGGQAEVCDVNHDGHADVRDLVLMTTCLRIDPPPGGTELCPDCDGNGTWAFEDLLCCAHRILQLPIVPRDSVNADHVQATLTQVMRDPEGGLLVRLRLTGADAIGAAMLRLRYPGERWRASLPVLADGPTGPASDGWLPLVDPEQPGVVQLGGLRLSETASNNLAFDVRFTPLAPLAGDEVAVEGADLASSDGTVFTLASLPSLSLGAPPPGPSPSRIELGPARPNPFTRSTSFTVSLPAEANVELSIHDLAGRRMATLLSGRIPAGRRDAVWDAAGARDGVYFARLQVNGRVFTQRVALLRDRR